MKKLLKEICWIIDYYFVFLLYNPHKWDRYEDYMIKKWKKDKFKEQ